MPKVLHRALGGLLQAVEDSKRRRTCELGRETLLGAFSSQSGVVDFERAGQYRLTLQTSVMGL